MKIVQYLAKFLAWYHLKKDAKLSLTYLNISEQMREARQLFRLFKSLFEVKRVHMIYESSSDPFSRVANISSRTFYCLHYLFENVFITTKACNLQYKYTWFPTETFRKWSRAFWLLGLALFLIYCCKTLRKTYTDESDLKVAALNKMTVRQVKENLQIICKLRHDYWLNFSRALLDFAICLNENDLPFTVVGKRLSPGVEGVCGMSSAVIYLYGLKEVILN